ncbi:MAG: FAD:protein FMN transferase [Gemmatimonadetes bacterium]|nr:FAD:protein FMN transferase [Gemmatimonadota bacterium]
MTESLVVTTARMGTTVTIQIVGPGHTAIARAERSAAIARADRWFERVTDVCSRFDPRSELAQLSTRVGETVKVRDLLYEAVGFALAVAEDSGGAFDPTVGHRLSTLGFNRNYQSGTLVQTPFEVDPDATYRDVVLDRERRTITIRRPLVLDLGAVAKGLAVDMAARELQPFENFAIDAGGDGYFGGSNAAGEPWSVGIRHPRIEGTLIETVRVSNAAVCTSGDYERLSPVDPTRHHLIDPRAKVGATTVASATVIAPTAMVADAFSTTAFVLGAAPGLAFLNTHDVDGLLVTPSIERFETSGLRDVHRFDPPLVAGADER